MSNGDFQIPKPLIPTPERPGEAKKGEQKKGPTEEAGKERAKEDGYKSSRQDFSARAQKMAQTPAELGRKFPKGFKPGAKPTSQQKKAPLPQRSTRTINPSNYRQLAGDKVFQRTNLRGSQLHQTLQQKGMAGQKGAQLSRQQLARLIQMRNQADNRSNMRQIIRYEIQQQRYARQHAARLSNPALTQQATQQAATMFLQQQKRLLSKLDSGGESDFEEILKKAIEGEKMAPKLGKGKSARFASKTSGQWKAFFTNSLKLGSAETPMTRSMSNLVSALYRGLYRSSGQQGMTLVSDLQLLANGRVMTDKFARILINNPELLALLEQLAPGDKLAAKILARLGRELKYKQLTHKAEVLTADAREAAREAALKQLKSETNASAQARMEQALLLERLRHGTGEEKRQKGLLGKGGSEGEARHFWYGGDPRWERERAIGKPKKWIFLLYVVGAILMGLAGFVIWRALF